MKTTTAIDISMGRLPSAVAVAVLLLFSATVRADITTSNRVVTTPRHVFTVDDTGLPAQLEIRAFTNDIPLAWRTAKDRPATLLRRIGRGPQLAAPVRLEAVIDKVTVAAKADAPAELQNTNRNVEATGTWQAGDLKGRLRVLYTEDGAMTGQVTFNPKGVALERLDLVVELSGPVDTAVAGNPAEAGAGKPLPVNYGSLDSKPGMLWMNGPTPLGDGGMLKGRLTHFFLGNGDRGFTWLAQAADGYALNDKEPSISVERNREGVTLWRIALVNTALRGGERTIGFTLLTHPARLRAPDRRLQQWMPWAEKPALPALEAAVRGTLSNTLVRADAGSVYEAVATRALLEGPAGGDALSASATIADRFPLGLFRYLSASHTALAAQLRPNAAALTAAGASPAPDRVALGRALLHDIGVDVSGLAGRIGAATVMRALDEFGYFNDDGQTEFLPYWRVGGILQFGEVFEGDVGFAVTAENPTARTRVSAFIRPTVVEEENRRQVIRRKTLFVLVNEGTNAVREYLYILDPGYLFAGSNRLQVEHIYSQLDFSDIAADGDWQRGRVERTLPEMVKNGATMARGTGLVKINGRITRMHMSELMDLETGGFVRMGEKEVNFAKKFYGDDGVKNGFLIYGPVYVPPRGMRLLYGAGRVELPNGVAGRVVDGRTGKPLSVPVHIFKGQLKESETPESAKKLSSRLATVQADNDGRFCWPGFVSGTILAEVDGKMYSTQPLMQIRNDGVAGFDSAGKDAEGNNLWPLITLHQQWPNNMSDAAGKWLSVRIEVGPPAAPGRSGQATPAVDGDHSQGEP